MRPARVALIGYGLAGRVFHAPMIAAVEGLQLAAIVSSRRAEIEKYWPGVAVCASPEEVFSDPFIDLVVVATPNDSHFALAARALEAGKHVVIDKPFALAAAEARELMARARGRILSVFHNRRWDSDFLTLKKLIGEGALGEVVYFESHFDRFRLQPKGGWREGAGPATGIWYDLGSHLLDQALQLFGPPLGIAADLAAQRAGAAATDYFRVQLRYDKLRVVLTGSALAPACDLRFLVHGSRASFIKHGLDTQEGFLAAGGKPDDGAFGADPLPGRLILPGGAEKAVDALRGDYRAYYRGIRDTLLGMAPLPVLAGEALAVMTYLEAGEESASRRCEITR
jgi:predicted dehydrogenase